MFDSIPLDFVNQKKEIIEINIEYLSWIAEELNKGYEIDVVSMVGPIEEYTLKKIDEIYDESLTNGLCYIVVVKGQIIAMAAFHKLKENVAVIKRMYVKPEFRGKGIGRHLLERLLKTITAKKYQSVYLDTGKFMKAAQALYRSFGFEERGIYPETEVPNGLKHIWIYMEKKL